LYVVGRLFEIPGEHLVISVGSQLDNVPDADIYDTEEALIPLLKLFLVEDLNSQNAVLVHLEIKALVPVWVEILLRDLRCLRLFAIDGGHCEGVWLLENISFRQAVGRDNCHAEVRLA